MTAGFTIIPNVLLEHQKSLGLDAVDLNILAQLLSYWWSKDNLPHPSKKTIALRMGVDVSTVRRRIAKMEKNGLIKRKARFSSERRRQANGYDLTDLIRRATPYAVRMIHRRDRKGVARLLPSSDTDRKEK
jgi:DNA-binding Lrp family transcriptional regulator